MSELIIMKQPESYLWLTKGNHFKVSVCLKQPLETGLHSEKAQDTARVIFVHGIIAVFESK